VPVEIGLEMYAEKPIILPFFTGHVSRGLLLHILRRVNPSLASILKPSLSLAEIRLGNLK
jgi:hypothetical protein